MISKKFCFFLKVLIAINAIANGVIDVKKIATHEFNLEDLPSAFDYVINNKDTVIKAVVKI